MQKLVNHRIDHLVHLMFEIRSNRPEDHEEHESIFNQARVYLNTINTKRLSRMIYSLSSLHMYSSKISEVPADVLEELILDFKPLLKIFQNTKNDA